MLKILFFVGVPAIVLNLFFLNATVVDGRPGEVISDAVLESEARKIGSSLETHTELYRIDNRPEHIIAQEGFLPNPNKPVTDLAGHVEPGFGGSGSFVSTSSRPANRYNLLGTDFTGIPHPDNPNLRLEYTTDSPAPKPYRTIIKEYIIVNSLGVAIPDNVGVSGEFEVTTNQVLPDKVSAVREIIISRPWKVDSSGENWVLDLPKKSTIDVGDFRPLLTAAQERAGTVSVRSNNSETYGEKVTENIKNNLEAQGLGVLTESTNKMNIPDTVIVTGAKPGISLSVTGETLNGLVRDTGKIRVSISDSLPAFSTDAKGLTINSVILGGKKIVAPNITFNMLAKNIVAETITPKAPPVVTNKVAETRVPTKIQTANATLAKGAGVLVLAQVTAAIQGVADSLNKNMGNPAEQQRILNQASATLNHTAFDTAVFTVKFAVESGAMIAVLAYVGVPASLAVSTTGIVLTTSEIIIPMSTALLTDPNLGKNLLSAINGDGSALASTIGVIKTDYNNAKDNLTNANNWTTGAGVLNDLFGFAQDRYEAGKEHIKDLINASKTTASNSLVKTVVSSAAKTAAVSSKKNEIKKNIEKNNPDAKFSAEELKNILKDADQYIKAVNKYLNDVDGNPNKPMLSKNGLNIQFTMPVAPSTEKAKQAAVTSGIVVPANVSLMKFFSPTGADANKRTPFISTDSGRIFAYDTGLEIVNNAVTPEYNDDGTLKSFKVRFSTGLTAEYPPFITPQKLDAGLTNWTSPNRVTVKPDLNFQLGVGVLLVTACSKNMPSTNFSQDLTQLSINSIIDEAIKNPTANVVCTRSAGPSTVASSTCNCSSSSSPSIVSASVCSAQPAAIRSGFALDDVSNIFAAIGQ